MADLHTLFQAVDELSPDEIKQLYDYILKSRVQFTDVPPKAPLKERVIGLHAHLGPAWMSDDFHDELPDEFWLGEEC
jgi:hypothetical protein